MNSLNTSSWIENLASKGRHSFPLKELKSALPDSSVAAIKLSLNRLTHKRKILSLHQGYYLIIPPEYRSRGIVSPYTFIDGLMAFMERPYYLSLLNAAAFHGASHQQPQTVSIMTNFPTLRPTQKKDVKIDYISSKEIPENFLEKRKTQSGYITISSPELTVADLIHFQKRVGGFSRVATILNELQEAIKVENINENFLKILSVSTIQRMGYLFDVVLENKEIANKIYQLSEQIPLQFFRIPLSTSYPMKGFDCNERWKIIENTQIEIDE
ncbi:MAG: type IV toxin-antitoxin system AbiEi family antitoxin [Arcicella sp.]|nr:type IV toxin-antitoxin system AbiEi family antitoxin [Arcicella sp.]